MSAISSPTSICCDHPSKFEIDSKSLLLDVPKEKYCKCEKCKKTKLNQREKNYIIKHHKKICELDQFYYCKIYWLRRKFINIFKRNDPYHFIAECSICNRNSPDNKESHAYIVCRDPKKNENLCEFCYHNIIQKSNFSDKIGVIDSAIYYSKNDKKIEFFLKNIDANREETTNTKSFYEKYFKLITSYDICFDDFIESSQKELRDYIGIEENDILPMLYAFKIELQQKVIDNIQKKINVSKEKEKKINMVKNEVYDTLTKKFKKSNINIDKKNIFVV
jgi:hypothetical protein